jgi:hypothetical protein
MKILHHVSGKLIIAAVAWSFAAAIPMEAKTQSGVASPGSDNNARLVVTRSADFGTVESINLFVDGVQVADLGVNQSYDGALPPGRHLLSISTNPKTYAQSPEQRRIIVKPGQTYAFTAVWRDSEQASLVP